MGVAQQIREPLQHLLVELGACDNALEWCNGRTMDDATWKQSSPPWRSWLSKKLKCANSFAAVSKAVRDGYGDGYSDGSGYGYGDGSGYGYGDGSGSGSDYGDGYGDGSGYGGYGYGSGSGSGDGYGDGDGDGDGSGYGDVVAV